MYSFIDSFIHSFIHTEHLYSASSRELLRGAPDSSTAKKSSLKLRKKTQVTRLYRQSPKLRREPIPDRGTHHGKSTALLSGGTSKRDQEKTMSFGPVTVTAVTEILSYGPVSVTAV